MIVAVTGGRDRLLTLAELESLDHVLFGGDVVEAYKRTSRTPADRGLGATVVRHGDCRGADKSVAAYLRARRDVEVEAWPADWKQHGKPAGMIRNRTMLRGQWSDADKRPDAEALVAFAGGRGTADCCDYAGVMGLTPIQIPRVDEPRPWNRHHGKPMMTGLDTPAPTLYCGRGTPVGNPWAIEAKGLDRVKRAAVAGEILARYRRWLWERIDERSKAYDRSVVEFILRLTPDHFAVCSCWPAHCHVEVVIAAWRWLTRARE